jgi:hypothetical protein
LKTTGQGKRGWRRVTLVDPCSGTVLHWVKSKADPAPPRAWRKWRREDAGTAGRDMGGEEMRKTR